MNRKSYKYDVFLSHSSNDKVFVRRLDKMLRSVGIRTFFDEKDIPWGGNIPTAIEQGLDESQHLIFVMTPYAVKSEWGDLERCVTIFRSPGGRQGSILPLLLKDCPEIPPALRILRYLTVRDDKEFQDAWPQIVSHLKPESLPHRTVRANVPTPINVPQRKCIAAVCPMFGASKVFYIDLISAIWRQAINHGYELLLVPLNDPSHKRQLVSHFPQLPTVNGIVFITCQVEGSTWLDECAALDLPVVLLHDNIGENKAKGYSVVSYIRPRLDGLAEIVNILISERGVQNPSVVMVSPDNHQIRQDKLSIIENTIKANGLKFKRDRQLFKITEYTNEEGLEVVDRIMERNPKTDAIITLADFTAVGVLKRLNQLGLSNKILVTGFDNVDAAVENNITTVDQQLKATGESALSALHNAIKSGAFDEFRIGSYISTTVVRRTSA
ncbi:MAG: TIR domain-containing protein [Thermodesulfovibrionales bacterium]|jgi:DNA-binding LacI/PurR family transcriptional regulator